MKTIIFDKLRLAFFEASEILYSYHSDCIKFYHDFSMDYNQDNIHLAWERLDEARKFVSDIKAYYLFGPGNRMVNRLSLNITNAYEKIANELPIRNGFMSKKADFKDEDFLF